MIARLGAETGTWVHNAIRGIDNSEVNPRTKIKSMLSAKSFRPHIVSVEQAERWIRIFAADIHARLVDEGVLENRRRPKTLNLSLRHASQSRSRQTPLAPGRQLDQAYLMELGRTLLGQIMSEGEVWPCNHLSMAVSGFEDGVTGNMGIGSFLVKGVEVQPSREPASRKTQGDNALQSTLQTHGSGSSNRRLDRKRRHPEGGSIGRFLTRTAPMVTGHNNRGTADASDNAGATLTHGHSGDDAESIDTTRVAYSPAFALPLSEIDGLSEVPRRSAGGDLLPGTAGERQPGEKHGCPSDFSQTADQAGDSPPPPYTCGRCNLSFVDPEELQSHNDWHLAVELHEKEEGVEERVRSAFANRDSPGAARSRGSRGGRGKRRGAARGPLASRSSTSRQAGGRGKPELEPGQRQLSFG
ncbi:hypothetical protein VUR80DRAFT_3958 [Thermomyces stellatus]